MQLDIEDYRKGVEELKFSVIARLSMQRVQDVPTNKELKEKLETYWGSNRIQANPNERRDLSCIAEIYAGSGSNG